MKHSSSDYLVVTYGQTPLPCTLSLTWHTLNFEMCFISLTGIRRELGIGCDRG